MEQEIIKIILDKLHSNLIDELYYDHSTKFEFPPKFIIGNLPFNILMDFVNEYYYKYKNELIKNGFIYAVRNKDTIFIEHFIENKDDLEKAFKCDILFQLKVCEYGIKHIFNKHFDKSIDDTIIINKYKDILNNYEKIYSITNMYRNIILDFLKVYDTKDYEIILDKVFTTNLYDNVLIDFNSSVLNHKNINEFKTILFKSMLSDCYLFIEDKSINDEELNNLAISRDNDDFYDEDPDEEFEEKLYYDDEDDDLINKKVELEIYIQLLKYLEKGISTKSFFSKKDYKIRLNLYSLFLTYNANKKNKNEHIINVSKEYDKAIVLKKLNPFYILDYINTKE